MLLAVYRSGFSSIVIQGICSEACGPAVDATLEQITKQRGFKNLLEALNFKKPDWSKYYEKGVNANDQSVSSVLPEVSLDDVEPEGWKNIRICRRKHLLNIPQEARKTIDEAVLASIPQVRFTSQALSR